MTANDFMVSATTAMKIRFQHPLLVAGAIQRLDVGARYLTKREQESQAAVLPALPIVSSVPSAVSRRCAKRSFRGVMGIAKRSETRCLRDGRQSGSS
jgi:hypothetical protein